MWVLVLCVLVLCVLVLWVLVLWVLVPALARWPLDFLDISGVALGPHGARPGSGEASS